MSRLALGDGAATAVAVFMCALAPAAGAQPTPVGPEFPVSVPGDADDQNAVIAAAPGGEFVVVWENVSDEDGDGRGIFGRRFAPDGTPSGLRFRVNTYTTSSQRRPEVAVDGAGNFVVVWESWVQDGSPVSVFGQRFDALGVPIGDEFQVNTYTESGQEAPSVAAHQAGGFVVTWQSAAHQDGDFEGIFGRRYEADGSPLGDEFQINTYTTGGQIGPTVAWTGADSFVVMWASPQDGDDRGMFGRRLDAEGNPDGGEFQINTYTTHDQGGSGIAADGSGRFVVVWVSLLQDGDRSGIFGQRFAGPGIPLGDEFQVNTSTLNYQLRPTVGMNAVGDFLVAWDDSLFVDPDVFGQAFDPVGRPQGGEFQINATKAYAQGKASVAWTGAKEFVVVWASRDASPAYTIVGQRYSLEVFSDGFESGDTSAWSATIP